MFIRASITLRQRLCHHISSVSSETTPKADVRHRLFSTYVHSHHEVRSSKLVKSYHRSNGINVYLRNKSLGQSSSFCQGFYSSESKSKANTSEAAMNESSGRVPEEDFLTESIQQENMGGEVDYTLKLTDEDLQEITKGDPELIKKVKYIQLEHEILRQEGNRVPSKVKFTQWKELLYLGSPSQRRKFYNYLWLNEMKSESDKVKKAQMREERLLNSPPPPREEDPYGVIYGLGRNSLFQRLYDTTVHKFYHNKVINAMMFSRPLVLDCGYDEFMTPREAKNTAKQIELLITQNRTHAQPFDLHLCNADPNSKVIEYLSRIIPTLYEDSYPMNITDKSYLEVFPKQELVYLTPHCRDVVEEYNEDEIYIVGAMVDKSDPRPFSLAKAKKENLRMKKLPLDKHLMWGLGTKSLTINQMASIMLDLRYTQDWNAALKHVPRRKLQRDFHPYPDDGERVHQPYRRESKSAVLEDFELLNQRKGFRRSDSDVSSLSFGSRSPYGKKQQQNFNRNKNNSRSIKYDYE